MGETFVRPARFLPNISDCININANHLFRSLTFTLDFGDRYTCNMGGKLSPATTMNILSSALTWSQMQRFYFFFQSKIAYSILNALYLYFFFTVTNFILYATCTYYNNETILNHLLNMELPKPHAMTKMSYFR